jgi:hypothetical protein
MKREGCCTRGCRPTHHWSRPLGSHNYSPTLIVVIALESLLFIGIGLWWFSREEF